MQLFLILLGTRSSSSQDSSRIADVEDFPNWTSKIRIECAEHHLLLSDLFASGIPSPILKSQNLNLCSDPVHIEVRHAMQTQTQTALDGGNEHVLIHAPSVCNMLASTSQIPFARKD